MSVVHGFERIREQRVDELRTGAELYRHVKTGAGLLSLTNEDENKVFGITFRTPPPDSTGVAHILEHSVLCGSRKYPVKEPFVELMKGSLQTFLNAFTYPDKTCYPVASQNLKDFYNLIDVYLDAVFYPRLTQHIFQQEGWHFELEDQSGVLTYKGVVFNEMKGAYSSPDRVLAEYSQQSLFPDHLYGLDSGGHPRHIPELSFEQFRSFHREYYHPSNAWIYFYGDDEPEQRLRLLNDFLKDFDRRDVDSEIPLQPKFDQSRRLTRPVAAGGESEAKGMITVNWLFSETGEAETNLALQVLNYILLGMPGSPLRKALIDSGLGEDLAGGGLEDELRQMYFSTGLKGIRTENADRVEKLVMDTLDELAAEGIDPLTVEAALNTVEFRLRETDSRSFPRGLLLMLRALTTWLYDGDPATLLAFEAPLAAVKSKLAADPSFFEGMLQRFFLHNSHRTTLVLEPDPGLAERMEAEERETLAAVKATLSREHLEGVIADTRRLKELQETPDPPEALATIPTLKLADLDRQNKLIPLKVMENRGTQLLYHDLSTNGIVYLDVGFNLHTLPGEYLPYVPLFGRALLELGTESENLVTLTQRISRKTGGIRPHPFASPVKGAEHGTAWLFLRGKAMLPRSGDLLAILRDVLLTVELDNQDRFRQMVLEEKARQEERLIPEGHLIVNLRLRAHFNEADWAAEQMRGVSYVSFLRELARLVEEDWPGVRSRLEQIRRRLVSSGNMLLNITVDQEGWSRIESELGDFVEALPSTSVDPVKWAPGALPECEGMTIPSQVNYVGKGANLYRLGYRFHGSAQVIARYLRTAWLWERVRVSGGAYGAFCLFNHLSGVLTFVSYRDPNLQKTLEAFDETADFLRTSTLRQQELSKSIIGTVGGIDTYLLPEAKGFTSMVRYLTAETDEERQQLREQVLDTSASDFRAFADVLDGVKEWGLVKVLGPRSAIDRAPTVRGGILQPVQVL
jgi:hypothetical protein